MKSADDVIALEPDRDAGEASNGTGTEGGQGAGAADVQPLAALSMSRPTESRMRRPLDSAGVTGAPESHNVSERDEITCGRVEGPGRSSQSLADPVGAGSAFANDGAAGTTTTSLYGARATLATLFGLGLGGVTRRAYAMHVQACVAAGIGVVALLLAITASDDVAEFPDAAWERGLQSHHPARATEVGWVITDDTLPTAALAQTLVENPLFEPRGAAGSVTAAGRSGAGDTNNDGLAEIDQVALLLAAMQPAQQSTDAGEMSKSAAVLASAAPSPAPGRSDRGLGTQSSAEDITVQLVAAPSHEQAAAAWGRLLESNRDLLADLQPRIIDPSGASITLYRLRAGPIRSVSEAAALCAALGARGVECLVIHGRS